MAEVERSVAAGNEAIRCELVTSRALDWGRSDNGMRTDRQVQHLEVSTRYRRPATNGRRRLAPTARRGRRILCQDRDNAGQYYNIVFFDSYESAMENSNLPVTQEFSQKMMALADGPPTFVNLDVLDERD